MLPDDPIDLLLLKRICAGGGLDINIAYLSRHFGKHKHTIRDRVKMLLSHRIIDRPVFPFIGLFNEYPLLVVSYADLPYDEKTLNWLKEDKNVFAAYRAREGESNMVIFEFHKDVWDYHVWREGIAADGKIPERGKRAPSDNYYFSNRAIFKYEPSAGMELIEDESRNDGKVEVNGYVLDTVALQILKALVQGEGIRVNENLLAKEIGISRKTVLNKITRLQERGIVLKPLCRFPHFFVPTNFLLILSMVEVRGSKEKILQDILHDPHVSLAYRISEGRYNLLLFECHKSIEDYLEWEGAYSTQYPGCFGSIRISLLSPRMTILIDQQKVSLGLIDTRLRELKAGEKLDSRLRSHM
jgi:DNA-binding Lrp family transcriptional regulator